MMINKAFTLLEVMIALAIISISVSSILVSLSSGATIPYDSQKRIKAVDLAVIKLHDIERKLKKDGFKDEDQEEHGDFDEDEFKDFHWIAKIKKLEIPDDIAMLSKMFLGGGDEGDSTIEKQKNSREAGMMSMFGSFIQMIKDTFEDAIREVEIEVYWYYGDEEEENKEKFTLVTHLINFQALNKLPDLNSVLGGSKSGKSGSSKVMKGSFSLNPGGGK